jgi:hypothetical protein
MLEADDMDELVDEWARLNNVLPGGTHLVSKERDGFAVDVFDSPKYYLELATPAVALDPHTMAMLAEYDIRVSDPEEHETIDRVEWHIESVAEQREATDTERGGTAREERALDPREDGDDE